MSNQSTTASFYDINPFYNVDSNLSLSVSGTQALKSAIGLLLTSPIGSRSRTFNSTWGSDLLNFINEPIDDMTAMLIRSSIIGALDKWEPRITVNASDVVVTPYPSARGYKVRITFKVVGADSTESLALLLQPNGY